MPDQRIAYVVNHVAFFVSHRLPLAIGARLAGFDVALFTGQAGSEQMEELAVRRLAAESIIHRRTVSRSSGMNPFIELVGLLQLMWFLFRFRPDVVHCASPKGILYGGIAARLCRVPGLVLAISGMGFAFTEVTERDPLRKIAKWVYAVLSRYVFRHPNLHVIVQNQDDRRALLSRGIADQSRLTLIPGSGVDLSLFADCTTADKKNMVLLPARMLKDKGVLEFVEAARKIKVLMPHWRFVMAGAAGYDNPTAISELEIKAWQDHGVVEWHGHVEDMVPLYRDASIVCLPSYREGMPKVLLEAAAACCAVVTTDVPGCREAIEPGVSGELVPVKNIDELAAALLSLIKDERRRINFGVNGRKRAESFFSIDSVVCQTADIYKKILS